MNRICLYIRVSSMSCDYLSKVSLSHLISLRRLHFFNLRSRHGHKQQQQQQQQQLKKRETVMAFCTAKLTELPLHNSISLRSHSSSLTLLFTSSSSSSSSSSSKPSFSVLKPFSSLRTIENSVRSNASRNPSNTHHKSRSSSAPWINKWPSTNIPSERRVVDSDKREKAEERARDRNSNGAIERIVLRLRNLGLGSDDEDEEEDDDDDDEDVMEKATGDEKLGDLLQRKWSRPDSILDEDEDEDERMLLPWERGDDGSGEDDGSGFKKRKVKAPSVAELTIEDSELRRLRGLGRSLRERINIPKAGVTQVILEKIHDNWRKSELVRLKFHETLAHDMRTAHEIVERRSGGLVIWRSGSVMVVYRGSNYERPSSSPRSVDKVGDTLFVPVVTAADLAIKSDDQNTTSVPQKRELYTVDPSSVEKMTVEEAEYKGLLDDLGPRFVDWWGTGLLPVDADLLPPTIPGYKTPFRLLPTGMRPRLTNAEMTNLRKLAKSLPCHFAIGRNRNHQGLASAIVKLWDKSLVAKIAIKRGIQNTNNKLMAEELKMLTGGILLLRNKFYIVIYRGKDFVPTGVASVLTERQELTKRIQDVEEKMRIGALTAARATPIESFEGKALAGTLAEFYEAQARWGREISAEEREMMKEEDSKVKNARVVRKVEHKLGLAQDKMMRAEKLLAKIEVSMVPAGPSDDQETITDEERFMFRRVGLKMKAYLPLGIRGVFDGVIENMHLHWKHRELVKLISKQKTFSFVEDSARLLEHESGGILVAIERVPKGYALIYYRGKNYQRPISLRPRNLLTKAKALKRSVAMQRHEALSQHISDLEKTIAKMSSEMGNDGAGNSWSTDNQSRFEHGSVLTRSEDEGSSVESDNDNDDFDEESDDDDDFDEESDDDVEESDDDDDYDDDGVDDYDDDNDDEEDNENLPRG